MVETADALAYAAMGRPSPQTLGWSQKPEGWLCEDCATELGITPDVPLEDLP